MMRRYILIDPFTNRPYLTGNATEALRQATQMNKESENHPAFILYRTDLQGRGLYVATLARKFGTDEFYWEAKK